MATQADINAHDQMITRIADELASGLESLLASAVLGMSAIDISDRTQIASLFDDARQFVNQQIQGLDVLALDNLDLNQTTATPEITSEVVDLKNTISTQMAIAIDEEVNSIAGELITAGLLGLGISQVLQSVSNRVTPMVKRLRRAFDQSLLIFTSVLTKRIGNQLSMEYTYTGGLIPNSRPFCTQHNGNTYTEDQINSIWQGTWQGKAPGDPFVVRGGYNCRHFWILKGK